MDSVHASCEVTREDFLAAGRAMENIDSYWAPAELAHKVSVRKLAYIATPAFVILFTLLVGRGESTEGMYVWGAGIGILLSGVTIFGLSRQDIRKKLILKNRRLCEQQDVSFGCGLVKLHADAGGLRVRTPMYRMSCCWSMANVHDFGDAIQVVYSTSTVLLLPKRAFDSREHATACFEQMQKWRQAAQLPAAARVRLYLAERDVSCPKCEFNLRGCVGMTCPECGQGLTYDELVRRS